MFFIVLFIRAHFYISLICVDMCSVCWFVLAKFSVVAKGLARKTSLKKPYHGEGSSPQSPGRRVLMFLLVYCIVSLFYDIFLLSMA